ncbi:MAG: hypothetical protein Q7R57_06545 [Dehalococcoidales bacterium]|nr:hypothetical protein [Dehalococcoidales bacterium]
MLGRESLAQVLALEQVSGQVPLLGMAPAAGLELGHRKQAPTAKVPL